MKKSRMDNKQLEIILNSIADGVFTIDHKKNITSFNLAAEKITGIPSEQAIGQKCFDVFHASICQSSCAIEKTMKTGKQIIDLPLNILNINGEKIPISISTAVLKNEDGKVIGGVETFRDLSTLEEMRKEIEKQYVYSDIVSKNHEIKKLFEIIPDIAESDSTVLIQGPSGSGKELFARAIHNHSNRKTGPYIAVNCAALPDTLLESELFGYKKGAFTDAKKNKHGRFALAENGTLFLDEIGDLSAALQVKLLRVLQERAFEPLGATRPVKTNARIIAATNKDLNQLLSQGRMREDFYYRINVIKINLPPLSKRREDIPLLVEHFVKKFNMKKNRKIAGVSEEVMEFFMKYDFKGNIRELENIIEHSFVLCRNQLITMDHLSADLQKTYKEKKIMTADSSQRLKETEKEIILNTLNKHHGNRKKTAAELNINPSTLWRKMKKLGVFYEI
jgi:PAS domain S-box-containing protein